MTHKLPYKLVSKYVCSVNFGYIIITIHIGYRLSLCQECDILQNTSRIADSKKKKKKNPNKQTNIGIKDKKKKKI